MTSTTRVRRSLILSVVAILVGVAGLRALGTGQSFNGFLETGYLQELYGVVDLGTDPNDPIARADGARRRGLRARRRRVGGRMRVRLQRHASPQVRRRRTALRQSTAHPRCIPQTTVDTSGGCGLVNHPDGTHMYSNSAVGVFQLDAATGGGQRARYPADGRKPGQRARHRRRSAGPGSITSCMSPPRAIRRCRSILGLPREGAVQDLRPGSRRPAS